MKTIAILFGVAFLAGLSVLSQPGVAAAQSPVEMIQGGVDKVNGNKDDTPSTSEAVQMVVKAFLFIIGAVSVVMIIFGGFKYITSAGEASAVTSAKNTILYAVVGLIVALLAYAITGFVIASFSGGGSNSNYTGPGASSQAPGTTTPPVQRRDGQVGPMP